MAYIQATAEEYRFFNQLGYLEIITASLPVNLVPRNGIITGTRQLSL
jgi:hypothetical protein